MMAPTSPAAPPDHGRLTLFMAVKPRPSHELLGFGLGILFILIFSQFWIMPIFGEVIGSSAGAIIRTVYFPVYGGGVLLLCLCGLTSFEAMVRAPGLMLMLIVAVLSMSWSIDPSTTGRRVFALAMTMTCSYAMAASLSWTKLARTLATGFFILMVVSLLLVLLVPKIGKMPTIFPGAWRGAWPEKNNLGGLMSLSCVIFLGAARLDPKYRNLWIVGAIGSVVLVLGSTSKTSLLTLLLGGAAYCFVLGLQIGGGAIAVGLAWLGVVFVGTLAVIIGLNPKALFKLLGKDATLTGRTFIWAGINEVMKQRPVTGFGYGAIWENESPYGPLAVIKKVAKFRMYHAHSSWYEMWLNLGVFGLGAWAFALIEFWLKALWAIFRKRSAVLVVPFLLIYTLNSLTESVTMIWNEIRWVLFTTLMVKLSLPEANDDLWRPPSQQDPKTLN